MVEVKEKKVFFYNDTATTEIYTLSLHDALPISQSFLAFFVENKEEAESLESYYRTKFFRHLVSLRKLTQDALRPMYKWVPQQTWDREWSDEMLYTKYKLTKAEIDYIESVIRPMDRAASNDK